MANITATYPNSTLLVVGHSLGGSLASLMGSTLNIPAVTFEAVPERIAAERIGLLPIQTNTMVPDPSKTNRALAWHFGNTADPVYMGSCNGFLSSCALAGYVCQSECFSGKRCVYNTVQDKGWRMSIANHRINYVIDNVLEPYDEVPECVSDDECYDCFNWKFG